MLVITLSITYYDTVIYILTILDYFLKACFSQKPEREGLLNSRTPIGLTLKNFEFGNK